MAALPIRHRRWRAAACATALVYATGVVGVPILHASLEAAHSAAAFEAEHTVLCPTLHGGPFCHAVASLLLSAPAGSVTLRQASPAHSAPTGDRASRPAPSALPSPTEARAPPLG
jgi:hypothetical protein